MAEDKTMTARQGHEPTATAGPAQGGAERSEAEPGAGPDVAGADVAISAPDPEVPAKAKRRTFSAKYKLRILAEADACTEPGDIGRLLRREGLYSSHLTTWRRARDVGALAALEPKKRGRKPRHRNALAKRVDALERDNQRLQEELRKARVIIDVQKKVAMLLGETDEDLN